MLFVAAFLEPVSMIIRSLKQVIFNHMQLPTTFRALSNPNFRLWVIGAFISNIGSWLQRTAQDWIVISQLTDHNAAAVGIVVFLQFIPQILLLPITGWAADRIDRRKLLLVTQLSMAFLALLLGVLAISGVIELWHVYACALGLGIVAAFDAPARHAFVSDVVMEKEVSNAVSLNSMSFHSARLIGPAIAGLLIAGVGAGWVFILNVVTFIPLLIALYLLGKRTLAGQQEKTEKAEGAGFLAGFGYLNQHREMAVLLVMIAMVTAFVMNFPVYLSAMTVHVFHGDAGQYGLLISMMAIGSIAGALMTASRKQPTFGFLVCLPAGVAVSSTLLALAPNFISFAIMMTVLGFSIQLLTISSFTFLQLSTVRVYRGRVMAIALATMLGSTALGAPLVGWIADSMSPRWSIGISGVSALMAFALGIFYYRQYYLPQQRQSHESA
ncbi:Enterobactin exporter EntS [Marinomonas gallaica]|uniref:Enterobactin exporter EntS n=2 Tax=Marinomonas gallaica TaxID=1806667 RepID=A0A1C3JLA6_9GAMM|nr:Enterobactin exporter EntS [Marinomonas gallaica]SBT20992.1 Enterobactin exporter EntS [Marinomonas gallaica]